MAEVGDNTSGGGADSTLHALRIENDALNEQVKLLTQTEQRLYASQNELDRQLQRVELLTSFALQCSGMSTTDKILALAKELLHNALDVDQVVPMLLSIEENNLVLTQSDEGVATKQQHVIVMEGSCHRFLRSLERVELWNMGLGGHGAPLVGQFVTLLDSLLGDSEYCPQNNKIADVVAIVVLKLADPVPFGLLLLRKLGSSQRSYFSEVPGKKHVAFLQLLGSHIEHAIQNAMLTRDLQERGRQLSESNKALKKSLDELERTQEQLVQTSKMEAIGHLAGGVAHDFNNLLTVILSYTSLLEQEIDEDSESQQDLKEIISAADRAAKLSRQLLAFGRKQTRRPEIVDVNDLVSEMANMLGRLIGEHISLELKLDPSLGQIHADPGQLEQIVLNLVVNARDATRVGGRITIETREMDAALADESQELGQGRFVMLRVLDTGHGMEEDICKRVFEPFFTTKEVGQGTGMGLAMVYGSVMQNEGHIQVYSKPGEGTRFSVYFPVAKGQARCLQPQAKSKGEYSGTEMILLVEDEDSIRQISRRLLTQKGYTVFTACNGEEAISVVEHLEHPIHLLITDVIMPKLGGVELAQRLRSANPSLSVLYMSGYTGQALNAQGVSDATEHYLHKPFTPNGLLSSVRKALG